MLFKKTAESRLNPDFIDVTLQSYRSRWQEAKPDAKSIALEQEVKSAKTLSLPAIYFQGQVDGVNLPYVSENVGEKYSGPFKCIDMPGVDHFLSHEAPELLSSYLIEFLKN
jgi:pimeloyl-ACP methyl ester carboxylesterase